MHADGTKVRRVTTSPTIDQYPSWSHDGNWLAFDRQVRANRAQVFIVDAMGNGLRQLTGDSFNDWGAIWLPR
jgi:Tol biopolymer transport system component